MVDHHVELVVVAVELAVGLAVGLAELAEPAGFAGSAAELVGWAEGLNACPYLMLV